MNLLKIIKIPDLPFTELHTSNANNKRANIIKGSEKVFGYALVDVSSACINKHK